MRIYRSPYFADIIQDARTGSGIWHWIVQREGSSEILAWSHSSSQEKAISAATERLETFTREQAPSDSAVG